MTLKVTDKYQYGQLGFFLHGSKHYVTWETCKQTLLMLDAVE